MSRNEKKLYDNFVNRYSLETLKEIADGEVCGDEILSGEDRERFGSLFNPKYPQLSEHYHPVRDGAVELHWIERNVFFNLGAAFGRRLANEPKPDAAKEEVDAVKGADRRAIDRGNFTREEERKMRLEEYLIEKLKGVDPKLFPQLKNELIAQIRRRTLCLIKGGRCEPEPDTLKGDCTL